MGIIAGVGGLLALAASIAAIVRRCILEFLYLIYVFLACATLLMIIVVPIEQEDLPAGSGEHPIPASGFFFAIAAFVAYLGAALTAWKQRDSFQWVPYKYQTATATAAGIGCFLAIVAVTDCRFAKLEGSASRNDGKRTIGYITRCEGSGKDSCELWGDNDNDPDSDDTGNHNIWKFAFAMGVIAGYGGFLILATTILIKLPPVLRKILPGVYFFLAVASAMMLTGFRSMYCEAYGGKDPSFLDSEDHEDGWYEPGLDAILAKLGKIASR